MTSQPNRALEAIAAFKRGEIIVVTDDDDRENEGDLIVAASHTTPEKMAFIIRNTSGIVCAPITKAIADRLRLGPMVQHNDAPLSTAFTVSVDLRANVASGISAEDRTNTVRALADAKAKPEDFVRPGHIFPLVARDGGVLIRSGHTEAAVDLCVLADLPPVGVICELVNDDGTVKRGPQLEAFAAAHRLKYVSVADIIALRQQREALVERVGEQAIRTPAGTARAITYATPLDPMQHLAVVFGDIGDGRSVPVRIHRERVAEDVFGADGSLARTLAHIGAEGRGVIVYLREGAAGVSADSQRPRDFIDADSDEHHGSAVKRAEDWREVGLGAQILRDLGVRSIRLIAARERRYVGLAGFGIAIEATEALP